MRFRILLITHYLIQEILGKIVLDFHVKGVKIKIFFNLDVVTMHLLQKEFMKKILMLVFIQRTICSSRDHGRMDG